MIPADGSSPNDFDGIDFLAYALGPAVYNRELIESRVMNILNVYFTEKGFFSRRCHPGGRGSVAGGTDFLQFLTWIKENWGFLSGIAILFLGFFTKVRNIIKKLRKVLEDRVIEPYKPSVIVEVMARTTMLGPEGVRESVRSFRSLLQHVPEIHARLLRELPEQSFTIKVLSNRYSSPYAYFAVKEVKRSDVAKMLRYLRRNESSSETFSAVRLYRKFGVLTRIKWVTKS